MANANLVSIPTMVESPFIIVEIGGHTFGSFSGNTKGTPNGLHQNVEFPSYMKSMSVVKVNGTLNTYTIAFSYQVAFGDDPNLLDKIFSSATVDRKISISYGDWNAPEYLYKKETGIITGITSTLNMASASIDYTVKCTSDAIGLTSTSYSFPGQTAKPSDVIMDMLNNIRYGFQQVFTGMRNMQQVIAIGLIASDDKPVRLKPQVNVTPLEYLNYLVNSMRSSSDPDDGSLGSSKYFLSVHDEVDSSAGGTYFKVSKVTADSKGGSEADTYTLDINYPTDNLVTNFALVNDQSWAILYEYSQKSKQQMYSYSLNNEGKLVTTYSPSLMRDTYSGDVSPATQSWWALMTGFPIQATVTIKGLVRPSILMSYVRLNVWFHGGAKHLSSGLYIITKQEDKLDATGYKTTLSLTRVGGDE